MFLVNSIIQCQSFGDVLGPCTCGFGAHLTPLCPAHLQHHLASLSLLSPAAPGSQSCPDPGFLICPGCRGDCHRSQDSAG